MGWGKVFMQVISGSGIERGPLRGRTVFVLGVVGLLTLSACSTSYRSLDWDLRNNGGSTASAAGRISSTRPAPDVNGVISYPGYQVVVARRGDTVASLAARIGLPADQLARYNALRPDNTLRAGEILALPVRVASAGAGGMGGIIGAPVMPGSTGVDVSTIATTALDRVEGGQPAAQGALPFATETSGPAPVRYQVKRGETAFTIARKFNISARILADWNGLGPDLAVREGQYLIIPSTEDAARLPASDATPPGQGSPLPEPPSASEPLPDEDTPTAAEVAAEDSPAPDLSGDRSASSAAQFAMPVAGAITRGYQRKVNDGIDISSRAGEAVQAAAAGVVAAVTTDPKGNPILVLKHSGGLLTVYTGIKDVAVAKGDQVKRGQTIARASGSSVHFEVRQGLESVDPLPYLQ